MRIIPFVIWVLFFYPILGLTHHMWPSLLSNDETMGAWYFLAWVGVTLFISSLQKSASHIFPPEEDGEDEAPNLPEHWEVRLVVSHPRDFHRSPEEPETIYAFESLCFEPKEGMNLELSGSEGKPIIARVNCVANPIGNSDPVVVMLVLNEPHDFYTLRDYEDWFPVKKPDQDTEEKPEAPPAPKTATP